MFRPDNERSLSKLRSALQETDRELRPFRKRRTEAIRHFVGPNYSDKGVDQKLPLLEQAVRVYQRMLIGRPPRVHTATGYAKLRPLSRKIGIIANDLMLEVDLYRTLRRVVLDALFGLACIRIGLETVDEDAAPRLFVDRIGFDDLLFDLEVDDVSKFRWIACGYDVPLDSALATRRSRKRALKDLERIAEGPLPGEEDRASDIAVVSHQMEPFEKKVRLYDVWFPDEQMILTLPLEGNGYFDKYDWDGPEHGPFHFLLFGEVPDNAFPLSPVAVLKDLHDLGNDLFDKCSRQALDAKTIFRYPPGSQLEAVRTKNASDYAFIASTSARPVEAIKLGGMDGTVLAQFLQTKQLFNWAGGNLDLLGGLGTRSPTLGQDEILSAGAHVRLGEMQARLLDFVRDIVRDLVKYEWENPDLDRDLEIPTPSGPVQSRLTAGDLEGDLLDHRIDIVPYSMQDRTPDQRLQFLMNYATTFALSPNAQALAQQQRMQFDLRTFNRIVAELSGTSEIEELYSDYQPERDVQPVARGGNTESGNQPRIIERVGRPGMSQEGMERVAELDALKLAGNQGQPKMEAA